MTEWADLVRRGRAATEQLGQAKWELGDLADEVETTYNGGQLQNFADEISVEYGTLRNYRVVARAFARMRADRGKASWTVYQMLAGREDRYDILAEREHWTVNEMRDRLGRPPQGYRTTDPNHVEHSLGNLEPKDRARLVGDLLHDPEIAEEVDRRVTDYVASDHGRIANVMAHRDAGYRTAEPREEPSSPPAARDYDRKVEQAVNTLLVALVAERNGEWAPSATSSALLYFLPGMLADRNVPDGNREELVSDELAGMFDQLETYANQQGGRDGSL